jgi:hypothetical protein
MRNTCKLILTARSVACVVAPATCRLSRGRLALGVLSSTSTADIPGVQTSRYRRIGRALDDGPAVGK